MAVISAELANGLGGREPAVHIYPPGIAPARHALPAENHQQVELNQPEWSLFRLIFNNF